MAYSESIGAPEVSVIVPVYNAEKYISRCVSSLLAQQTKWEFEILLIDDGSKDNSLALLKEWQQRDGRIRVFSQANRGPSAARNYGLREACGKYIVFVDSDDWVEPYYIKSLRSAVDANNSGLVIGGFYRESPSGVIDYIEEPGYYTSTEFHRMIKDRELYRKGFICGKIYDTCIIRNCGLYFHEKVSYGEDLIFLFSYLLHANYVRFIDRCGYHYDQTCQVDSLVIRYNSYESEISGYRLLKQTVDNLMVKYYVAEEELGNAVDRVAYFALRAIKVMYRPGIHHLDFKNRQCHLQNDWTSEDIGLLKSYSGRCRREDKIICSLLYKRQTVLLDAFLSFFFFCRYSWLGRLFL